MARLPNSSLERRMNKFEKKELLEMIRDYQEAKNTIQKIEYVFSREELREIKSKLIKESV